MGAQSLMSANEITVNEHHFTFYVTQTHCTSKRDDSWGSKHWNNRDLSSLHATSLAFHSTTDKFSFISAESREIEISKFQVCFYTLFLCLRRLLHDSWAREICLRFLSFSFSVFSHSKKFFARGVESLLKTVKAAFTRNAFIEKRKFSITL